MYSADFCVDKIKESSLYTSSCDDKKSLSMHFNVLNLTEKWYNQQQKHTFLIISAEHLPRDLKKETQLALHLPNTAQTHTPWNVEDYKSSNTFGADHQLRRVRDLSKFGGKFGALGYGFKNLVGFRNWGFGSLHGLGGGFYNSKHWFETLLFTHMYGDEILCKD
ncbi:hypothetical protein GQX74_005524 [Glossina fuscipes]|nr:hypothetical protein GQX74_005524 [Glossina fuscipes]